MNLATTNTSSAAVMDTSLDGAVMGLAVVVDAASANVDGVVAFGAVLVPFVVAFAAGGASRAVCVGQLIVTERATALRNPDVTERQLFQTGWPTGTQPSTITAQLAAIYKLLESAKTKVVRLALREQLASPEAELATAAEEELGAALIQLVKLTRDVALSPVPATTANSTESTSQWQPLFETTFLVANLLLALHECLVLVIVLILGLVLLPIYGTRASTLRELRSLQDKFAAYDVAISNWLTNDHFEHCPSSQLRVGAIMYSLLLKLPIAVVASYVPLVCLATTLNQWYLVKFTSRTLSFLIPIRLVSYASSRRLHIGHSTGTVISSPEAIAINFS
ncbi:Aste57867_4132 [Aphanomyces stellatus]|uniref:Aste57867_4132 protein n=1 Tax=Aphanomyces stellatus TaxID=120398 RepID=A0A485KCM7_9STRA|nr:hypothetical protein As57867_004121 [Aphanomyces stellatus]VFT81261.1 Aste57867_4132 [Aphanomyces stellatus]